VSEARCRGPEKQRGSGPPLLKSRKRPGASVGKPLPNPSVAETRHLTPFSKRRSASGLKLRQQSLLDGPL
jgi:hypothetical protein